MVKKVYTRYLRIKFLSMRYQTVVNSHGVAGHMDMDDTPMVKNENREDYVLFLHEIMNL